MSCSETRGDIAYPLSTGPFSGMRKAVHYKALSRLRLEPQTALFQQNPTFCHLSRTSIGDVSEIEVVLLHILSNLIREYDVRRGWTLGGVLIWVWMLFTSSLR